MKYLTNKKLWAAIIGLVTAFGTLMVTLDEAKANTSFPQGFALTGYKASKVDNGTSHAYFGPCKVGSANAWVKAGWSDNSYANVEIWCTGVIPTGCTATPNVTGFTKPYLSRTGSYSAGTLEGLVVSFFNFMPMNCSYQQVVFDTNINGVLDTAGMEIAEWRESLAGAQEYQSSYVTYNSTLHTKLAGANNLYGAYVKTPIIGKYQIGVGSEVNLAVDHELYYFYQYWEGGVLKRKYLKQISYADTALADSTTATPIYSKTKIEAGKIVFAGTVPKVAGRVYYVKVDYLRDGVPNYGYDIEVPQFP